MKFLTGDIAFGVYLLLGGAVLSLIVSNFFVGAIAACFIGMIRIFVQKGISTVKSRIIVVLTYLILLAATSFPSILSVYQKNSDLPLIAHIVISAAFVIIYGLVVYAFFSFGERAGIKIFKKATKENA